MTLLFQDDIDNATRHDDDFDHGHSFKITLTLLRFESRLFDVGGCGIGREVEGEAGLSVEGNAEGYAVFFEIILAELRPFGIAHAGGVAQGVPQLFGDVRGEGGEVHFCCAHSPTAIIKAGTEVL